MIDIYSTNDLIEVVKSTETPGSFLGRYFPTGPKDLSAKRDRVIIERKAGSRVAAPFVVPYHGSKLVEREGYWAEEVRPAFINPARELTIGELKKKGLGETEYDDVSEDERAIKYLAEDMADLTGMISLTREHMRGQILCNGEVDVTVDGGARYLLRFYEGDTFGNKTAKTTAADAIGDSLFDDVAEQANDINGAYGPLDLILGAKLVAPFFAAVRGEKLLDMLNASVGNVSPEDRAQGTGTYLGTLNFYGKTLRIYSYTDTAMVNGTEVSFIDPKSLVILPREKFGATKYGAITQMESDEEYHTYSGEMVPRVVTDIKTSTRVLEMCSACLPVPYLYDSWRVLNYANAK